MNLGLTLMHFLLLVPRLERLLEIPGIREFVPQGLMANLRNEEELLKRRQWFPKYYYLKLNSFVNR